ncbi:MAG: two-component sensor histidine kinase [Acidobacteria bacterium]|nr:MAG: two-component sensor histidine kinase [Acidobacteriota bacterium]
MMVFALVIGVTAITLQITVRKFWEQTLREQIERNLKQKTLMFAQRVETDRQHALVDIAAQEGQAAGTRATVIDSSGMVLADSEADPRTMENHAQRPEFIAALSGHVGIDQRSSHTLGIPFLYVASPVSGGAVRLAYTLSEIETTTRQLSRALLWGSLIAFAAAMLVGGAATQYMAWRLRRIVNFAERVAAGDLTARIASTSGDEIGQVASALDKTARRVEESFASVQTSQRELETLLNSMQDAVIAVDADARVQWANRGMNRLLPWGLRLNAPVADSVRDPYFLSAIQGAMQDHAVRAARSNTIVSGRTFDVTAAPMPGGGAVAVLRDLTETERMEKTRRDFIANVSHELRTPLTSIQGYAETLLDTSSESNHVREFLEIIRKNAARMSRLTEDLLTLARVESGEQRFDIQEVSAGELLQDALESFREVARSNGIELSEENETPSRTVLADREAIHQVFSNLIENAFKYAAAGKKVVLGARAAGLATEFYVSDFGPGISSEHLPRLFERFYRVDKARSRESGGTGLGLAIAKHIVLAHGGTIRAESELNHGSTFVFTLPGANS